VPREAPNHGPSDKPPPGGLEPFSGEQPLFNLSAAAISNAAALGQTYAIGLALDEASTAELRAALSHPSRDVWGFSALALARRGATEAVPDLARFLVRSPAHQAVGIDALGRIGGPEALAAIAGMLDTAPVSYAVFSDLVRALLRIGTPEAMEHIAQAYRADPERRGAIKVLLERFDDGHRPLVRTLRRELGLVPAPAPSRVRGPDIDR
jgi:HEAT repeat protein